ncbi:hypothetical protein [Olleya sp. Bg11-27]|uniref:hypothetical protein n=1 Tax=Olleya sp. Bg11-27 TaxID=2058135 RepID=UPI000C311B19|nr:hypothetical protein [Olleya sp. Bg11-27]AUC77040.1 hypothetical protein CW732_15700 [Olleya sp. Bg11-27]
MKKKILKAISPITLLVVALFIIGSGCPADDGIDDEPETSACDYEGYDALDTSNNTTTLIPEAELTTDFFYTSSNGPEVEIYETSNPGDFWFVTTVVTANAAGTGQLSIDGVIQTVNVTCLATGSAVGEGMQFIVTGSGLDAEFCVKIDEYH